MNYDLNKFANGALLEKFNSAMFDVTENIADPNTSATAKRKVVITLTMTPFPSKRSTDA